MKLEETKLSVVIATGYNHEAGDEIETANQRIDKASFYIRSLFNLIKLSAQAMETGGEDNDKLEYYGDLIQIGELGYAVADSIQDSTQIFTRIMFDREDRKSEKKRTGAKPKKVKKVKKVNL